MATLGKCPQAQTLATLIDGEMSRKERADLEEHIAACDDCYRVLTESTEVWWRLEDDEKTDIP